MACDLAEFVGAALGFHLLFGLPLLPAGVLTGVVDVRDPERRAAGRPSPRGRHRGARRRHRRRVRVRDPALAPRRQRRAQGPRDAAVRRLREHPAGRGHPRRHRDAARDLPALVAHAAARRRRQRRRAPAHLPLRADRRRDRDDDRRARQHGDADHGGGHLPLARPDGRSATSTRPTAASGRSSAAMPTSIFGIALLASGLSSSSVGTLAGQVVMQGYINRQIPLFLRRMITMAPALMIVLAIPSINPSSALVISQVGLSLRHPVRAHPARDVLPQPRAHGRSRQPPRDEHRCLSGGRRDRVAERLPALRHDPGLSLKSAGAPPAAATAPSANHRRIVRTLGTVA